MRVFLAVGLVVGSWAWSNLRSTFKAGAGSWKGFRENWRDSGRMETDGTAAAASGVIVWPGDYWPMELSVWQRLQYSFRAIPASSFTGPKNPNVERAHSDSTENSGEAKAV
jgi:hypothetical protein